MQRVRKIYWSRMMGVLLASAGGMRGAPGQQTAAAPTDEVIRALVRDLSDDSYKVREAAQRRLEKVGPSGRAMLAGLAAEVKDEEARARLMARVEQMDEELAVDPPPITLKVTGASLATVVDELRRNPGMNVSVWAGGREGETFTVDMADRPFWDVYAELTRQHPLTPRTSNGFALAAQGWGIRSFARYGGFIVFVQQLSRTRIFNPQADPGQQMGASQMSFSLGVAADPRISVVRYSPPVGLELRDELGRPVWKDALPRGETWNGSDRTNIWSHSVSMNIPEKAGPPVVTVRGTLKFTVQVGEQRRELANVDQHLGEVITVGGRSVSIDRFEVKDSSITFTVQDRGVGIAGGRGGPAGGNRPQEGVMRMTFVDADGKSFWSTSLSGSITGSVGANFRAPVTVVLNVTLKTREVTVPFELKDVPLPK